LKPWTISSFRNGCKPEAGLLNKSSCLAQAQGVT
jgi:hypothetical protein